jgi:hypothetical protein
MGRGPFSQRFRKLSAGLAEVIEGYSLVGFTPLAIQVREEQRALLSWGRGVCALWKLSAGLAEVIEGYSLVGFTPLAIQVREVQEQ